MIAARAVEPIDARFVPAIRQAAAGYTAWGRVDERPNIAPDLCRMPMPEDYGSPSHVRLSQAETGSPHGKKLYYLWASAKEAYLANQPVAPGFAVVKEAFGAVDHATPESTLAGDWRTVPPVRSLEVGGKTLWLGAPRGLYVIAKVAAGEADGTDAGWVYGTIDPEGRVTSAGKVGRCIACHEGAPHERLFGLAR